MDIFEMATVLEQQQASDKRYLEFLRVPALSAGLYVLEAGAEDTQKPHTEDEVYYIVSGKGAITVGTEERAVKAGSVVYVGAAVKHFFHTITERLVLLVLFAPAEYANAGPK